MVVFNFILIASPTSPSFTLYSFVRIPTSVELDPLAYYSLPHPFASFDATLHNLPLAPTPNYEDASCSLDIARKE